MFLVQSRKQLTQVVTVITDGLQLKDFQSQNIMTFKFLFCMKALSDGWLYSSAVERCTCNAAAPGSNPGGALSFTLGDNPKLNLAQPSLIQLILVRAGINAILYNIFI